MYESLSISNSLDVLRVISVSCTRRPPLRSTPIHGIGARKGAPRCFAALPPALILDVSLCPLASCGPLRTSSRLKSTNSSSTSPPGIPYSSVRRSFKLSPAAAGLTLSRLERVEDYAALQQWSVDHIAEFWEEVWKWGDGVVSSKTWDQVSGRAVGAASWDVELLGRCATIGG